MPSSKMTGGRIICVLMLCTLLTSSLATAQIPSQSLQSGDTKIEYQSCKAVKVSGDRYFKVVLHFRSGSQSFYGPYSGSNVFQGKGKYGGEKIVSVSVNTFGSTVSKDNPLSCKSDPTTTTTTTSTTTTTPPPTSSTTTTTSTPTTTTSTTITTTSSPSTTSQSSTTQNTGSGGSSTTAVSTSEEPGSTDKTTNGEETTQPVQSPTDSTTTLPTTEENNSTGNFPQSQGDAGSSQNETGGFSSILLALLAVGGLLLVGLVGTIAGWKYRDKIFKSVSQAQ